MSEKKLAATVNVNGETYEAGTVPPPEVAAVIDNPKAWGEAAKPDEVEKAKPAAKRPARS